MTIMDLEWWEQTAKRANRNVDAIRARGVDAFVVLVGAFSFGGYDKKEDAQRSARELASAGVRRESIRVKRVRV